MCHIALRSVCSFWKLCSLLDFSSGATKPLVQTATLCWVAAGTSAAWVEQGCRGREQDSGPKGFQKGIFHSKRALGACFWVWATSGSREVRVGVLLCSNYLWLLLNTLLSKSNYTLIGWLNSLWLMWVLKFLVIEIKPQSMCWCQVQLSVHSAGGW